MKEKNYRGLVTFCVFLFGGAMAFFVALAVLEQLEINPVMDIGVSAGVGLGVAAFIMAMIGIHRWLEGFAFIKMVMIITGICLSSLTIFGVYSGMQSSWFRNITKSESHQRLNKQADVLSNLADEQSGRGRITKAGETAKELVRTNEALNEMERTGSHNAENQWAQGLASTFGGAPGAWAFGRHTMIGLAIDLVYYLSVWFFFYSGDYYRKGNIARERPKETESHAPRPEQPIPVTTKGGNGIERPPSPTPPATRQELNLKLEDDEQPIYDDEPIREGFAIEPGFRAEPPATKRSVAPPRLHATLHATNPATNSATALRVLELWDAGNRNLSDIARNTIKTDGRPVKRQYVQKVLTQNGRR